MHVCGLSAPLALVHVRLVPLLRGGFVRYRATGRPNEPSKGGQAILDILEKQDHAGWEREFGVTSKWWKRRGGADHVLTMSAPVTGFRHPKGMRGWGHYLVQLAPPIFLSVELTRSFVKEYPKCSAKNVVLPYPIPGRDWHNGAWRAKAEALFGFDPHNVTAPDPTRELGIHRASHGVLPNTRALAAADTAASASLASASAASVQALARVPVLNKPIFAFYSGGNHGCTNVRQAISGEVMKDPACLGPQQRKDLAAQYRKLNPREGFDDSRGPPRQVAMAGAKFCACPEGDSPSAKRQYDAVVTGCVPVLVSNEALFAYSSDNGGDLDPRDFRYALRPGKRDAPIHSGGGCLIFLWFTVCDTPSLRTLRLFAACVSRRSRW